jgi:flagellar hook protein FlgE
MLGTIYVGLAGMNAYSKGLDVISNNVANLNTTGFKAGLASFSDVVYRNGTGATTGSASTSSSGAGVHVNADSKDFRQGETRSSNDPLDTALDGNGFFVLERDGQRYYTRAGTFEFNKDGILTERNTGAQVMMSSDTTSLGSLNIDPFRTFPPRATTEVNFTGNLARTGSATPARQTPLNVRDTTGNTQALQVKFTRDAANPLQWTVEVTKTNSTTPILGSGILLFNADGTPAASNTAIQVTVTPDNLPAFTFSLNFGAAGSFVGVTSLQNNNDSLVQVLRENGLAFGTLDKTEFDERGNLRITYTNGETKTIGRLVLASFDSGSDLSSIGGSLYVTREGREPRLSAGMEFGLGRVSGSNLEMSNVELTDQFSELIIIQRGYQASSQMTSVANEMLQQLLSMQNGR